MFIASSTLTQTPYQIVKETAEKFIAHFSKVELPDTVCSQPGPLLTNEQLLQLKEEAITAASFFDDTQNWQKGKAQGSFYFLSRGGHTAVWGHHQFSSIVVKLRRSEIAAQEAIIAQKAHNVAIHQRPFWCRVPLSTFIDVPEMGSQDGAVALYVEEKMPLVMTSDDHKQFWVRIFIHLESTKCSSVFRENMVQLVCHMSRFIEETGFWDVGYRNFPEVSMDGKYVCVVDFEKIDSDKTELYAGLKRLAELFPLSLFTVPLFDVYQRIGISAEIAVNETLNKTYIGRFRVPTKEDCIRDWETRIARSQKELEQTKTSFIFFDKKNQ